MDSSLATTVREAYDCRLTHTIRNEDRFARMRNQYSALHHGPPKTVTAISADHVLSESLAWHDVAVTNAIAESRAAERKPIAAGQTPSKYPSNWHRYVAEGSTNNLRSLAEEWHAIDEDAKNAFDANIAKPASL